MENQPIKDPNDLYEALLALLVRAREGGLQAELIQILFTAVDKVTAVTRKEEASLSSKKVDESKNRQHFRLVADARGTMIVSGERTKVVIHDVSPQGFGVISPVGVRTNTTVMLEAPSSAGGMDIFSCFVSHSRRTKEGVSVGLRIVDMLPRF